MKEIKIKLLKKIAFESRKSIIRMAANGGAFVGASLSCVDIVTYIYFNFLNFMPDLINSKNRDYFFLSKGHAVPAVYSVFAELGILDKERLERHLTTDDDIYWHPNQNIQGVDFHSGSLGHSLSIAIGIALDFKLNKEPHKVVVLLGDGELDEGSNWEAMLIASAKKLNNLIIIIDRNKLQANTETEDLTPLEPLKAKFKAFGLKTRVINGHSFKDIHNCFSAIPLSPDKPSVIIAKTVRGKGIPEIENQPDKWFMELTEKQADKFINKIVK